MIFAAFDIRATAPRRQKLSRFKGEWFEVFARYASATYRSLVYLFRPADPVRRFCNGLAKIARDRCNLEFATHRSHEPNYFTTTRFSTLRAQFPRHDPDLIEKLYRGVHVCMSWRKEYKAGCLVFPATPTAILLDVRIIRRDRPEEACMEFLNGYRRVVLRRDRGGSAGEIRSEGDMARKYPQWRLLLR